MARAQGRAQLADRQLLRDANAGRAHPGNRAVAGLAAEHEQHHRGRRHSPVARIVVHVHRISLSCVNSHEVNKDAKLAPRGSAAGRNRQAQVRQVEGGGRHLLGDAWRAQVDHPAELAGVGQLLEVTVAGRRPHNQPGHY